MLRWINALRLENHQPRRRWQTRQRERCLKRKQESVSLRSCALPPESPVTQPVSQNHSATVADVCQERPLSLSLSPPSLPFCLPQLLTRTGRGLLNVLVEDSRAASAAAVWVEIQWVTVRMGERRGSRNEGCGEGRGEEGEQRKRMRTSIKADHVYLIPHWFSSGKRSLLCLREVWGALKVRCRARGFLAQGRVRTVKLKDTPGVFISGLSWVKRRLQFCLELWARCPCLSVTERKGAEEVI